MKNGILKKITAVIILLSVCTSLTLTLSSCNRSYDEEEVLAEAHKLLKNAEILNEVYYGDGIATRDGGVVNGYYLEADSIHLSRLGFESIDGLRSLTRNTFTKGYCEEIFSTKLDSISDEYGILNMARYYQHYNIDTLEPVCIMVYTKYNVSFKDSLVYDYSSLRVSGVKGQTVTVTVDATVTNKDGMEQNTEIDLYLIEEDNGWRIDNPCYANYNEYKDKYDELNK